MLRTRLPPHILLGVTEEQWIEMGFASHVYTSIVDLLVEEQRELKKHGKG